MSYILCDMNCDKETNKSDIEEHCSDCLHINESTGGLQQELSATKAWRSTSVVEGRDHPNTLSSRRSHRKKKNRRGSGILNRRKVKLIRKLNRKWRWRNKWKIKLFKLQRKALSTAPEPPGMNITNKGTISTESEPRRNVKPIMGSGGTDLDLTANTESLDGGQTMEDTQHGSRATYRGPARRDTRRRTTKRSTTSHASHPPPLSEGGVNPKPSGSRWLNAERDTPPRTRRAKHVYPYQTLKWYKQIGGHLNYTDNTRCPRGPIQPIGPNYKNRKPGPPNKTKGRTGGQRTEKHPTDEVTESTSHSGTHCLKTSDSVGAEGDHQTQLMDTAQGCKGNNINLQKPVRDDLQYHHNSPVQGASDGEARAADNSAVDDDGTAEGSAEGIESKIFDKPQDLSLIHI